MASSGTRVAQLAKRHPLHAFLPGFSLFFATVYAPFAIAGLLTESRFDLEEPTYVAIKIFGLMAIGTLVSTVLTKTPLVLAPAVGLTVFFVHGMKILKPEKLCLCAFVAGLTIMITNWIRFGPMGDRISLRHYVLEQIPEQIKSGVKGGVGALLAEKAVEHIIQPDNENFVRIAMIVLGTLTLVVCDFRIANARSRDYELSRLHGIFLRSSYFFVPAILFISSALYFGAVWIEPAGSPWMGLATAVLNDINRVSLSLQEPFARADYIYVLTITAVIVFVLLTDIPGTPYEFLSPLRPELPDLRDTPDGKRAISNSFYADGVMSILGATLLVPPSIYYAENFVLRTREDDEYAQSRQPAYFYCAMMALVGIALVYAPVSVSNFTSWSGLAVAPVLLVIGIKIVASAMSIEHEHPELKPEDRYWFYVPTAITVTLTPIVELQMSIPSGIVAYCFYALLTNTKMSGVTIVMVVVSSIILILMPVITIP